MSPPKLPPYNVKQRDVNKVAGYLNRLSARLSIPKLSSSDSQSSVNALLKSIQQLDQAESNNNLASTQRIMKPSPISPVNRSIEKLQPTFGNPFASRIPSIGLNATSKNLSVRNQEHQVSMNRVSKKDSLLQNSSNANIPTMAGSQSNFQLGLGMESQQNLNFGGQTSTRLFEI